jgi:hypothetical protein
MSGIQENILTRKRKLKSSIEHRYRVSKKIGHQSQFQTEIRAKRWLDLLGEELVNKLIKDTHDNLPAIKILLKEEAAKFRKRSQYANRK